MVTFSSPKHVRRETAGLAPPVPVRTSETHPMNVSWVAKCNSGGRFGLTFCPGKTVCRGGVRWCRSLDMDLERLKTNFGVTSILCLLSQAELSSLQLRRYGEGVQAKGIQLISFPIVEMQAPDSMKKAASLVDLLQTKLCEGEVMIIHCRGGVGRAGLIASCLLLQMNMASSSADAIAKVRKLRCRSAVESYCQEQFIAKYANFIRARASPVLSVTQTEVKWELFQRKTIAKNKYFLSKTPDVIKGSQ